MPKWLVGASIPGAAVSETLEESTRSKQCCHPSRLTFDMIKKTYDSGNLRFKEVEKTTIWVENRYEAVAM
jgi:hypothetical protein